ncbi:hypothetical protein AB0H43_13410 [Hamadaea sp. NPDC050747]|uniref:hypothetical protein n=1 Tax=Hamadaea sp. NPDC050747 TaxID=3155789 RepID=UPI0033D9178D
MTMYTVSITPDDPGFAVTTIRLDITEAAATIRELRLTPGDNDALVPSGLPVLDLGQLVAAVAAAVLPGSVPVSAPVPVAPITERKPERQAAGKATDKPNRANKSASKKQTPARVNKAPAVTSAGGGRTYRRVPDDFDQVLRQAGGNAAVIADHYDVPRHTAYSWIRSARKRSEPTS